MALVPMRLRLEAADASGVEEYRIEDGNIEVRNLRPRGARRLNDDEWYRLTPAQLSHHVYQNTVVAQWLETRIGWRRLLRACAPQQECPQHDAENVTERRAA